MCFNFAAVRATCPHQQTENAKEGWYKDRETNNDNKRTICLRRAASKEEKKTTALNKISHVYFGNAPETSQIIRSQDKHDGNKET